MQICEVSLKDTFIGFGLYFNICVGKDSGYHVWFNLQSGSMDLDAYK